MSLAETEWGIVLGGVGNPSYKMEEFHEYKDLSDIIGIKGECSQNQNNIYQGMSPDTHNATLSLKWILGLLREELLSEKKNANL